MVTMEAILKIFLIASLQKLLYWFYPNIADMFLVMSSDASFYCKSSKINGQILTKLMRTDIGTIIPSNILGNIPKVGVKILLGSLVNTKDQFTGYASNDDLFAK